jgi:hypothetical protein
MYFSPAYISSLIVEPLRFYFANYGPPDLVWDPDPKIATIEIDTINNFNKIAIQFKPRILVSRGGYVISPTGLTDNMAEATSSRALGLKSEKRFLLVAGQAQILIEAVNEGTCEKVLELTENFLSRSAPTIANVQGFKQFALPLSISPCTPGKEDVELFQCSIGLPWRKETHYLIEEDGIQLKDFLLKITTDSTSRVIDTSKVPTEAYTLKAVSAATSVRSMIAGQPVVSVSSVSSVSNLGVIIV